MTHRQESSLENILMSDACEMELSNFCFHPPQNLCIKCTAPLHLYCAHCFNNMSFHFSLCTVSYIFAIFKKFLALSTKYADITFLGSACKTLWGIHTVCHSSKSDFLKWKQLQQILSCPTTKLQPCSESELNKKF